MNHQLSNRGRFLLQSALLLCGLVLIGGCLSDQPAPRAATSGNLRITLTGPAGASAEAQSREYVVWVESLADATLLGSVPTIDIDLGRRQQELLVTGTGAIWALQNKTGKPLEVELVSRATQHASRLGRVPGPGVSISPQGTGWIDVRIVGETEPRATVFVAPTPFANVMRPGQTADFIAIPRGDVRITCLNPSAGQSTAKATVKPGKTSNVSIAAPG